MAEVKGQEHSGSGNLAILTKVDKLRELIGNRIALPQLVVVGDQSSGKSSVLENLTGFAFPRAAELCTRYATQITCRREQIEAITVSIIPNQDASPDAQAHVKKFHRTLMGLDQTTLAQVFKDANEAMGIRPSGNDVTSDKASLPAFSKHTLRIEKFGPNEEHFTVIDVPGIFRNETEGLTVESDIILVRDMVKNYMKDPRTIILAIMPSNVDPATQEILKLAKQVDQTMSRTMAVLTKPDLAIEPTTQQIAIDHVMGKRNDLILGYYIVKNRGPDHADMTLEEGQMDECEFFAKAPWSALKHTDRAGIDCLKRRVRELLIDLIKKEFPQVKLEVIKELNLLKSQRDAMGPSRDGPDTQREYLNKISETFQSLVRDALGASYARHKMFSNHTLRLMTRIVEANESYSDKMARTGHTRQFQSMGKDKHSKSKFDEDIEVLPDLYPGLREIFDPVITPVPKSDMDTDILDYIEGVYTSSRGQELGTFSGSLLGTMFQEQSKKWEPITVQHITLIIWHVHHFIHEALRESCPDSKVFDELWNTYLLDELHSSYCAVLERAKLLLKIERDCCPITYNHYFNDNLQKEQSKRLVCAVEKLGVDEFTLDEAHEDEEVLKIPKSSLQQLAVNKSNSEHVREYMHDVLYSYYKVSRKRFVDVVCQQAVNYYLLAAEHSPLKIFNMQMVLRLNEDQLDTIAGEDLHIRQRREKLTRDIANFEAALKTLKGSE
ncbi:P-loop containing nucleoside triphosphate hydrolase protein [Xylaria bambusicola]|uniref:P-loop containing nucleoside triphosphate hydrolase protein n=1 Tax=Xylaria bambusicola TaxID=326684 RepID=UPI002008BAA7|nr:P-loop containing nucleoside triphosphate hydrolase protein [Xylaria bambusicola]KAI0512615.1 P-loop containing nucleoside triphosphate hydrolase protein [Xylaria bambusicola]